jgi:hypothetical protein
VSEEVGSVEVSVVVGELLVSVPVRAVVTVSGETFPSAPETNKPSANSATSATGSLMCNFFARRFIRVMPAAPYSRSTSFA